MADTLFRQGNREENVNDKNKVDALNLLAVIGWSLENFPNDLVVAIEARRILSSIILRYLELEERLLADDLFFANITMECGVGLCTKDLATKNQVNHDPDELQW